MGESLEEDMGNEKKLTEEVLKQMAKAEADGRDITPDEAEELARLEAETPVPGQPLPEAFENFPPGDPRHLCLDRDKRFQPDWHQLKIAKMDKNTPARISINTAIKDPKAPVGFRKAKYSIPVGTWVDVPPCVMDVLKMAEVQQVEMVPAEDGLAAGGLDVIVRDSLPRFSYQAFGSGRPA